MTDCETVLALISRLRAAERDAARYRWIRDESTDPATVIDKRADFVARDEFGGGGYYIYEYRAGQELDDAIDAAMSEAKP